MYNENGVLQNENGLPENENGTPENENGVPQNENGTPQNENEGCFYCRLSTAKIIVSKVAWFAILGEQF